MPEYTDDRPATVEGEGAPALDEFQLAALKEQQQKADQERIRRLDAMALSLSSKRKAAIDARAQSGIEQIWLEDEDAFDGIDDANRAQEGAQGSRHRYTKSKSSAGTYTKTDNDAGENKCILLPNITGPYCEAGAASIADMLLPLDDWPFGLGPTPIPELTGLLEQVKQFDDEQSVQLPGAVAPQAAGDVKAQAEAQIEKAKKSAEKAETRIRDWLTECQWHGKSRRQIDDSARVGTGIVKGPVPAMKKQYAWHNQDGVQTLEIKEETKPVTETVDFWNLYPDYPACGESIHNGSFVWERGEITCKTLQDLRGQPGYIDSQIELCLSEGPQTPEIDPGFKKQSTTDNSLFEIWWFHGALERADLEAAGCDCSSQPEQYLSIPAVITVVNGKPIRASMNVLDKGTFPYDVLTWRRRPGSPWGQGIARQIRPAQRGITACFRALMENAGLSAKPMLAVLRKYLSPVDGTWDLFGGKVFEVDDDADVRDVKAAIQTLQIDSRQSDLLAIIQFLLKLAEDITGQPLMLQGQMGKAPDTVGGMTILNNNASVTKRRIARQFDDQVIEPGISRYYDYLMQYGEDEEEKGLFVIDARSSSVLVERDIQNQNMIQLLGASGNPAYGADPRKAFAETCKAMKIDPKRIQYDDEQWKKIQDNAAKAPPDPRIAAAQINADAREKLAAFDAQMEAIEADKDRQFELIEKAMDAELALRQQGGDRAMSLDEIKAMLAKTVLQLRTQKELSVMGARAKQLSKPPTEPAGRAPAGQAFQR